MSSTESATGDLLATGARSTAAGAVGTGVLGDHQVAQRASKYTSRGLKYEYRPATLATVGICWRLLLPMEYASCHLCHAASVGRSISMAPLLKALVVDTSTSTPCLESHDGGGSTPRSTPRVTLMGRGGRSIT